MRFRRFRRCDANGNNYQHDDWQSVVAEVAQGGVVGGDGAIKSTAVRFKT
jgi:hypothetical protein